jgi:hypothetical protein
MPKMKSLSDTLPDKEKPLEWRVHHFVHFTSVVSGSYNEGLHLQLDTNY